MSDELEPIDPDILALLAGEPRTTADQRALLLRAVSGGAGRFDGYARRFARLFALGDAAAASVLADADRPAAWEAYVDGVQLLHFQAGAPFESADAGLVRFRKGLDYPRHRHLGDEVMFLLQGGLVDDRGVAHVAGDILQMGEGTEHGFRIMDDEDCIAAVLIFGGYPVFVGAPGDPQASGGA